LRTCSLRRTMAYAAANNAAGSLRSNRRRFYNYYNSSHDHERHHTIVDGLDRAETLRGRESQRCQRCLIHRRSRPGATNQGYWQTGDRTRQPPIASWRPRGQREFCSNKAGRHALVERSWKQQPAASKDNHHDVWGGAAGRRYDQSTSWPWGDHITLECATPRHVEPSCRNTRMDYMHAPVAA